MKRNRPATAKERKIAVMWNQMEEILQGQAPAYRPGTSKLRAQTASSSWNIRGMHMSKSEKTLFSSERKGERPGSAWTPIEKKEGKKRPQTGVPKGWKTKTSRPIIPSRASRPTTATYGGISSPGTRPFSASSSQRTIGLGSTGGKSIFQFPMMSPNIEINIFPQMSQMLGDTNRTMGSMRTMYQPPGVRNLNSLNTQSLSNLMKNTQEMGVHGTSSTQLLASPAGDAIILVTPKNCSTQKVEQEIKTKIPLLNQQDMEILFTAKCKDLGVQCFSHQMQRFFEYCSSHCYNGHLFLSDLQIGARTAAVLNRIILLNSGICELNLSKNRMGDMGIELLSQSISRTKSLIHLDVSSNEISSKGGRILFNSILYNESITCLYAGNMEGLHRNTFNDTGIQPLEAVLDYNQFLSFLNLGGTLIGNEGLRYVANGLENNKTLYQLNIAQNYLSLPSLEPFISIMQSKRLIDVDASNNPFGDKFLSKLTEYLRKGMVGLRKLNLGNCHFTHKALPTFLEVFRTCTSVETLNLDGNTLMSSQVMLSTYLTHNNSLKHLYLNNMGLGDPGAHALGKGFEKNQRLEILSLRGNKIKDAGIIGMMDGIRNTYVAIKFLDLSFNQISEEGGLAIAEMLVVNISLTKLVLFYNETGDMTGKKMIEALRKNTTLCKVNLKYNRVNLFIIDQIKA